MSYQQDEQQSRPRLKIFLCHAASNKELVRPLYSRLQEAGFDPWLDIKGIVAGREWNSEIEKALHTADMVLFCLTPDFIQKALDPAEYIKKEIATARRLQDDPAKGGNFIIPVRLERCQLPPELDLDRYQRVNLYQEEGYELLLTALSLKLRQLDFLAELPLPLSRLVGREQEIARLQEKFRQNQPPTRLVTLTGPGGVGKTTLSLALAGLLLPDFPDGVHFIELANLSDPALVVPALVRKLLPVAEPNGQSELDNLKTFLSGKQLLLILDNFEQVVAASKDLAELLRSLPGLKVLVSSRERLNLREEVEFPVLPLRLDGLQNVLSGANSKTAVFEEVTHNPAATLFVKQAQLHEPSFELHPENVAAVAQICLLLEGLPLALELAAARTRRYAPAEMLERLKATSLNNALGKSNLDLPDRHRSLQLSLDWSYKLLSESRQKLFGQLAVFVGDFSGKAAEAVCQVEEDPDLEGLESLMDKSLLRARTVNGQRYFFILESIRQYALEKLGESGKLDELQARHARYFLKLAEEAEPRLTSPNQTHTLVELEQAYPNLRAAHNWGMAALPEKLEVNLSLGGALWRFWLMRGYLNEGREWLETALQQAKPLGAAVSGMARAKALKALGTLCVMLSDLPAAIGHYEASLKLARELDDRPNIASLLNNLGIAAGQTGDYTASENYSLESLALFREMANPAAIGQILNNLGLTARYQGDYPKARSYLEESLTVRRKLDDKWGIANTLSTLGDVLLDLEEWEAARAALLESLHYQEELGDRVAVAHILEFLAGLAAAEKQPGRAIRLLAAAGSIREETGALLSEADKAIIEKRLASVRANLEPEQWQSEWQVGQTLSFQEAIELALET